MERAQRSIERGGFVAGGLSFLAGLCTAFGFCLLPLGLAPYFLGRAIERGETGERDPSRNADLFAAGVLAYVGIFPFLGSMCVAMWVLDSFLDLAPDALGWALVVQAVACVLGSAALAPIMAAGPLRLTTAPSAPRALGASLALAARRPFTTAIVGAAQGLAFSLPVGLMHVVGGPVGIVVAIAGCAGAWSLYPTLASGLAAPTTRAPRSLALVLAPTIAALAAVPAVWLVVSLPLWQPFDVRHTTPLSDRELARALGDDGARAGALWLAPDASGERPYVRIPREMSPAQTELVRDRESGRRVVLVRDAGVGLGLGVPVDDDFRRLDDTPVDRIRARVSPGLVVLALLAFAALALAASAARSARRSLGGGARLLVTTPVVVRLGDGATLESDGETLTASGDAWLETREGDGGVRIDRPLALPTTDAAPLVDGTVLVLVSRDHAPRFGPRTGAAPLPAHAWLAGPDGVEGALALHATRAATLALTLGILLALLAGCAGVCAL